MSGIEPAGEADADIFAKIGDLRQCGDIANALLLAQNVYSNAPKSAQAFIELLHCLMAAHRESEGLQLLTQKAKDRQVSDQLLALHIAVLSRLRRFEEAIAIGCDAIKEHPEWRLVWIALGRTFLDSSRPTEALQYIVEARDSTWHDWRGAYWHIVALTRLCRYEEAERIAGELIRRHPTQPRAYLALGEVLIESGHYARAIHCLDHALQIQPSNSQAWSEKIEALRRSRDFLAAAEAAVAATAQCSNSARILVATAWLHSAQDHEDQAVEEVERALVIDPRYPWALRSRIVFLRRARRYQEAHQAATEALQHHPDDPDLYVTIAWLHSAQGNYDQAVASTQQALTVDPRHSWALSSRILLLRMARRYQEAHQAASEALEHHLDDPDLYVAIAWLHSAQGNYDQAVASTQQALAIDPRHAGALRSRIDFLRFAWRYQEAHQAATEALQHHPDDPHLYVAIAWLHSAQDHEDQAVEEVERALAIDPRDTGALRSRVDFLRFARRYQEAHQAATEALQHHPDDPDLHAIIAWLHSAQGNYDQAVASTQQALAIDPRHADALRSRIDFLRFARRYQEAHQAATEALQHHPEHADLYVAIAWLHSAQDHEDQAVEQVERALAVDPRNSWALRSRIDFLRFARRYQEAHQAATEALQHHPDDPDLHVTIARLHSAQDHEDQAVEQVERALAVDPRHAGALRSRIDFLRYARRYQEAHQAATEALQHHPDDPDLHVTIAWLHSAQDHEDQAVEQVERALVVDPRDTGALRSRVDFLRMARRYQEAHQAATEALQHHPDDPDLHVTIAWLHSAQDHEDQAVEQVERALAVDPRNSWALRSRIDFLRMARRYQEAHQAATEALQHHPDDPDLHVTIAWLHSAQDHEDQAVEQVERALAVDPRHLWALSSRIDFLRYARRYQEAHQAATEALQHHPDDPDLHVAIARLHSAQDHEDQAVEQVERALAVDPRHAGALRSRVDFLRYARRYQEAHQAATEALQHHPDDADLYVAIAWLHSYEGNYDRAVSTTQQALSIGYCHSWALRSRIDFLRFARRYQEAHQAATEALQHHPNDPDLHVTIATLNSAQARYEDALRCCELAITFSPGHERAIEGQVYVLRQLGHFDRAEQVAKSALNQNHCSVSLYTELGRVYDAQLKFDAALASFASALELDPNDTEVNIARSATLRSLRRWSLAERDISRLRQVKLHDLDLLAELGWIYHDQGLLGEAERKFKDLLEKAVSEEEKALAHQCLGWVAFAADNFPGAELEFREALSQQPGDESHLLAVAWSLARQGSKERWREAQEIIYSIEGRRPISISTSAQICLGVLSFKLGSPASAEHHFKKALEIDPFHASHTDLGALYAQIGRDDEAEAQLSKAIERDWYDVAAHIELGSLALRKGDDHLRDAEREFRRSLGIEPVSADAAVGLAQVLIRHGDESEAETVLRSVLVSQNRTQRWRLHLALARLLIQRGDKSQNSDLHAEAYAHAQHAIEVAPDREADPHYVAGIAQHRIGSSLVDGAGRLGYRRRAVQHLRQCLKRDPAHIEAQRSLQIIEREMKASRPAVWGGYAIATISFSLLAVMWTSFFVGNKVTAVMVTTATPILAGMFTIAVLLPALIRFKLPGFEADLQAGSSVVAPGPTGDVTFGPGRFTVTFGPKGQLSRREAPLQN